MERGGESNSHFVDVAYSIGIYLRDDGTITDTIEGMSAAKAGIGPGMKLIGVNGRNTRRRSYTTRSGWKSGTAPLELLVENTDYYKTSRSIITAVSAILIYCVMNQSRTFSAKSTKRSSISDEDRKLWIPTGTARLSFLRGRS